MLARRAGVGLGSHDVYANLAGGLDLADPGLDLPLTLALASSLRDKSVPRDLVAIGEVGLLWELRPVPGLDRRLREAARLAGLRAGLPAEWRGGRLARRLIGKAPLGRVRRPGAQQCHQVLLQVLIDAPQLVIVGDLVGGHAETGKHRDQDQPVPGLEPPADGIEDHEGGVMQ